MSVWDKDARTALRASQWLLDAWKLETMMRRLPSWVLDAWKLETTASTLDGESQWLLDA